MSQVLKQLVGDNIDDTNLNAIVTQTIKEADGDHDGRISRVEFEKVRVLTMGVVLLRYGGLQDY